MTHLKQPLVVEEQVHTCKIDPLVFVGDLHEHEDYEGIEVCLVMKIQFLCLKKIIKVIMNTNTHHSQKTKQNPIQVYRLSQ